MSESESLGAKSWNQSFVREALKAMDGFLILGK